MAVKLLKPEAMKSDLFTGFLYEIRAMQCLSHPSLIRLYGIVISNPIMMVIYYTVLYFRKFSLLFSRIH